MARTWLWGAHRGTWIRNAYSNDTTLHTHNNVMDGGVFVWGGFTGRQRSDEAHAGGSSARSVAFSESPQMSPGSKDGHTK